MEFVLLQMIPTSAPLLAVFAKEDGTPQFEPVTCLATVEFYDGPQDKRTTPARAIVGYTATTGPLTPADTYLNFCGYEQEFAGKDDRPLAVAKWAPRVVAKLAHIEGLKKQAAQQKILVAGKTAQEQIEEINKRLAEGR